MSAQIPVPVISVRDLLGRYDTLFMDAFGVLVQSDGAMPGAGALIDWLNHSKSSYFILTNDASRRPEASARRYQSLGLSVQPERIITSGSLIAGWFSEHKLTGARCLVLGTPDTQHSVQEAGGVILPMDTQDPVDVIVVGDDEGFDYQPTINTTLSVLLRQVDAGCPPRLLLPNPDLIYPRTGQEFGFASGAIALILQAAMTTRYPNSHVPQFECLGKPHPAIFEEGVRRSGGKNIVMVGDQLGTDIRGALDFGIDAALIGTGVNPIRSDTVFESIRPTWILSSLSTH